MNMKSTLSAVISSFALATSAFAMGDVCYRQDQTGTRQQCTTTTSRECHDETRQNCTPTTRRECTPWDHQVCYPTTRRECTNTTRRECNNEPRQVCNTVYRQECHQEQQCRDVPDQVCRTDAQGHQVCQTITRRECSSNNVCHQEPRQECHTENNTVCRDVPDSVCRDVPDQVCNIVHDTQCRDVPDQVCNTTTVPVCNDVPHQSCTDVPVYDQVPYDCGVDNGHRPSAVNTMIFVNGNAVSGAVFSLDNHSLVPVRSLFEALGASVVYNGADQSITATYQGSTVVMHVNSRVASVNGKLVALEAPPTEISSKVYIPLRFAAESLNAQVVYDQATDTIRISTR